MKFLLLILCFFCLMIFFLAIALYAFMRFHPVFGGKADEESAKRIKASPNFNGKIFSNLEATSIDTASQTRKRPNLWSWLISVTHPPKGKQPSAPLPSEKIQTQRMQNGDFIWLGHSTILMKIENKFILTDPVFYRASPVFIGGKPFATKHKIQLSDLPKIDILLLSHDHYDHLDYKSIKALRENVRHYYVPLGVKAHLQRWGILNEKIEELDWFETIKNKELSFTLLPTRHYGSRRLGQRGATLWGAWAIDTGQNKIYFNGDSGYGKHFAQIGEKYGPFDIAFMENGAYNENWAKIHMFPEESAQALVDIRAKIAVPIHWAKFDLAYHTWKEPIERFMAAAKDKPYQICTPKIGQIFSLNQYPQEKWWEKAQ